MSRRHDLGTYDDGGAGNMDPHISLTWRGYPKDTLSDWKIIVKGEDGDKDEDETVLATYYVHKSILGAGEWRGTYFEAMFKNNALSEVQERQTCTSTIRLKCLAAEAMEAMLDHMYFGKGLVDGQSTSSVALRSLAKYFGIRTLFEEATSYIDKDLNVDTASRYLRDSTIFSDDKVMAAAIRICADNIDELKKDYLKVIVPNVFRDIIRSIEAHNCSSHNLSRIVANYCRLHPNVINEPYLASITDAELIPQIAPDECLYLLNLYHTHNCDEVSETGVSLSTLRDRSMEVCKNDWEKILSTTPLLSDKEDSHDDHYYSSFPDGIKREILEVVLRAAKEELDDERVKNRNFENMKVAAEEKRLERLRKRNERIMNDEKEKIHKFDTMRVASNKKRYERHRKRNEGNMKEVENKGLSWV